MRNYFRLGFLFLAVGVILYLFVSWSVAQLTPSTVDPIPTETISSEPSPESSPQKTTTIKSPIKIGFVGDIMLDRWIWTKMQSNGLDYPFQKLAGLLDGYDLLVGNLEGPITERGKHAVPNGSLLFKFDPSVVEVLKNSQINLVSLANNHTYNQGAQGLIDTRSNLDQIAIDYFGDPKSVDSAYVYQKEINGWKLALIGWNQIEVEDVQKEKILALINELDGQFDLVIVMPHWGPEYHAATANQKDMGRALIDAGADLVIGSHPHIVQEAETYNNRLIVYSLGNFIFDQSWSVATQEGLMVLANISESDWKFDFIPIDLSGGQPRRATSGTIIDRVMERLGLASEIVLSDEVTK